MGFTQIIFLLASAAIAGPILAHLFNRAKFRRVPFTMVQFLQLTQKQTQSRRRLREFLILLLRCTIILLIAVLFAGPVMKKQADVESWRQIHYLVLDDSVSMLCKEGGYDFWQQMETAGKKYIKNCDPARSVFNVYTMTGGFLGKNMTAPAALHTFDQLKPGTGASKMNGLIADINKTIEHKGGDDTLGIHIVSDFTPMFADVLGQQSQQISVDSITYQVIGKDVEPDNLAVTDAHVVRYSEGILTLSARVANYGRAVSTKLIQARAWKHKSQEHVIKLGPSDSAQQLLEVEIEGDIEAGDFIPVEIHLTPDDSLSLDNVYRFAVVVNPDQQKNILVAGETESELFLINKALESLYGRSGDHLIHTLTYSDFSNSFSRKLDMFDAVIFASVNSFHENKSKALKSFIERGGDLIFFAGGEFDKSAAEELFSQGVIAACPERLEERIAHIKPLNNLAAGSNLSNIDTELLSVVDQYKVDQAAMWSYYNCRYSVNTAAFWEITPQANLLYVKACRNGKSSFVNTSIDDSFSALTKSPVILSICELLIGTENKVFSFDFASDESVVLPAFTSEMQWQEQSWLIDQDDKKILAEVSEGCIVCPGPHSIGWIKSVSEPICYGGINAVDGETNLMQIPENQITKLTERHFTLNDGTQKSSSTGLSKSQNARLDKYLIVLILILIFADSAIANRIKR